MNKLIKIFLSAMIVSISALIIPPNRQNEDTEMESETMKSLTIEIIENQVQVCEIIDVPQKSEIDKMLEKMDQELIEINTIEDREDWFLAYRNILFKYVEWFGMPQTIFDAYTEEEITYICRTVETECYDQDFMSKCNVASVILNRVEQGGEFGDSVIEVITKPNQFAFGRENITESTILSIMYVYEIGDTTGGCLAFRSDRCPKTWYDWQYAFTDDAGHYFYK